MLVETETVPAVSIKVCAEVSELAPHLPNHWKLHEQRYLMAVPLPAAQPRQNRRELPSDYVLSLRQTGPVTTAEIRDNSGDLAASGRIAITPPFAIVDDIGTEPAHRRRGLGVTIMTALNQVALDSGATTGILVATPEGHALYTSLGWETHTPYASAYLT